MTLCDDFSESPVLQKLNDGKRSAWIKAHLDYPNSEFCLIWPFGISEGTIQVGTPPQNVFRLMCEHRNGPPPTDKHQAAHSCGRRHDGCVNPWHLSWKTNGENQEERYQQSGLTKRFKLTPEQVDEIRSLKDRAKIGDVVKQFGVSYNNIRSIWAGRLWNNTSSLQRRVFTDEEVRMIRTSPKMNIELAAEFGVLKGVIGNIRTRTTYKYVRDAE
jgi:hypothetical protein